MWKRLSLSPVARHPAPEPATPDRSALHPDAERVPPTVLVVDDQPLFRLFVAAVLKEEGYEVLEACSGEEALEVLAVHHRSLALLLSDVGLPRMTGGELGRRARQFAPALPQLLMSAADKQHWLERCVLGAETELLRKPFSITELLSKLEQLVPRRSGTFALRGADPRDPGDERELQLAVAAL